MENYNQNFTQNQGFQQEAPNAIAVLVLGIFSIVLSCGYGIGFIPAIIAIILSSQAHKELKINPNAYTDASAKNIKTGRITAFVGLGLSLFLFILMVFIIGAAVIMESL